MVCTDVAHTYSKLESSQQCFSVEQVLNFGEGSFWLYTWMEVSIHLSISMSVMRVVKPLSFATCDCKTPSPASWQIFGTRLLVDLRNAVCWKKAH